MKHRVKSVTSIALTVAMLATSVFSGGGVALAESGELVQMETSLDESGSVTENTSAPEVTVTGDGISVSDTSDSIEIQTVEEKTGATVAIQEDEISVDNSQLLSVSAFNKSDADSKFRLYFWDGVLPEEKENWNFSSPNMDVFLVSDTENLTGELTVNNTVQDVDLHFVQDKTGEEVKARYILADLPSDSSLSFDIRVDADAACDVAAITSVDDTLFEGVSLSWNTEDIVVESETETEAIIIEPETNDIVIEDSIVIESGEAETEVEGGSKTEIETSVETETDVLEPETEADTNEPEESNAIEVEFESGSESEAGVNVESDDEVDIEKEIGSESEPESSVETETEAGTSDETETDVLEQETPAPADDVESNTSDTEDSEVVEVGTEAETETGAALENEEVVDSELESEEHFLKTVDGIEELNPEDFATMRLVVLTSNPEIVIDPEHVIANYDTIYLLQYGSVEQAMNAYMYYMVNADAVEPDAVVEMASEILSDEDIDMDVTEEQNPISALSEESDSDVTQKADRVIALIDTGASEGPNVIDRISLIDDALEGSNSHANDMVTAIVSQNPDAKILSIRAMGDDGRGTVSSIVAAMEYAMNQNVSIINLSLYAKTNLLNSVLESEIQKAVSMGIDVVGAAGNDGADVSGYMPGSVVEAWIIGACDANGVRLSSSNFGATVDYYVVAESTSDAAAKFSGYVSANGTNVITADNLIYSSVSEENTEKESEDDSDGNGETDTYSVTACLNINGGVVELLQDGKYLDNFWYAEGDSEKVTVEHASSLTFVVRSFEGYRIEGYRLTDVNNGEVLVTEKDILDENKYLLSVEYPATQDMLFEASFVTDDSTDASQNVSRGWNMLYLAETLTLTVGSEFDPGTYLDDIQAWIPEDSAVELVYSDVDMETVGLYNTVYHISSENEYFAVRRPVDVVEEGYAQVGKKKINFITNTDGVNINTKRIDYAQGEEVEFSVESANSDITISRVSAYLSANNEDSNLVLGDEIEVTTLGTRSKENITALDNATFTGENAVYYSFTMPNEDVFILIEAIDGTLYLADGTDDELTKFTVNTSGLGCGYYNSNVIYLNAGRTTRYRTVTYSYKDSDGTTRTTTVACYCLQPLKSTPLEPGSNVVFSSSNGSVTALADSSLVAKGLFYLYGGPMWGRSVEDSDGNTINMKEYIDSTYPLQEDPYHGFANTDWRGYFALTHFILAYLYAPSSPSIWNYADDAYNLGPVWNSTGIAWLAEIRTKISKLPKPTVALRKGSAEVSGTTIASSDLIALANGNYRTPVLTYSTYDENTASVTLPTGISMVYGGNTYTGRVTGIPGGTRFYLIFDLTKMTLNSARTFELTLTSKFAVNFEGWKIAFTGDYQDLGFGYRTGDKIIGVTFALPEVSHIQIKKTNSAGAWNANLKGAQFTLYEGNKSLATVTIQNANYHEFSYDCEIGHTYVIKETKTPAGYATASNITCTITGSNYKATYQYTIQNPDGVEVEVTKKSTAGTEILGLSSYDIKDAEFGVYKEECSTKLGTLKTGTDGVSTTTLTLPCQAKGTYTYWVREDKAPAGHDRNTTPKSFTVTLPTDAGKTIPVEISDDPEFPEVDALVEKKDNHGWAVPGVVVEAKFYDSDKADPAKLMKTWYLVSDDREGKIKLDYNYLDPNKKSDPFYTWDNKIVLPKGYLTIQEIEAPATYQINDEIMEWDTTGEKLEVKKLYNDMVPCKIKLKKYDKTGATPLVGVEFSIEFVKAAEVDNSLAKPYTALLKEGESTKKTTDSNGEIVFDNLDQGTYRITEVKTTAGHSLLKEPIEVTVPITMTQAEAAAQKADTSKAKLDAGYTDKWYFYECLYEITNTPTFSVPMTGSTGTWKYGFVGIAMMAVLGVGGVVYGNRRRRRRKA